MAWRLHLTNQTIQEIQLLPNEPPLLAVWTRRGHVAYFELDTGARLGELTVEMPDADDRQSASWRNFVDGLVGPNGAALPLVALPPATLYSTSDGRMRLYHLASGDLFLEKQSRELALKTGDARLAAVAMDRSLGLVAALDNLGKLRLYQQQNAIGMFDFDLRPEIGLQPQVAIADGGAAIFVTDGQRIVLTNASGNRQHVLEVHYPVGRLACSPNGEWLATSDRESGVLRVYNGRDLTPTYQRHAVDLLTNATQLQLLADLPPATVALGALAVGNDGLVAFAMSGVVCVTDVSEMDSLPQPQPLL